MSATSDPGVPTRRSRRERVAGRGAAAGHALERLIATAGTVGIGVALGAILTSQKVQGWVIGLVVAVITTLLLALIWNTRRL